MKTLVLKAGNVYGVQGHTFIYNKPVEVDDKLAKYLLSKVRTVKVGDELVEVNIFEEFSPDTEKKTIGKIKKGDKGGK
jgi:hypothetical protein